MAEKIELCPTCGRPVMREATCKPGPANVKCEECEEQAAFIQHGRALCFRHREAA